ncbi:MAG: porin family protein [Bacteroidia bacterium]
MKKIYCILVLIAATLGVNAQNDKPMGRSSFGVFGGVNMQNINGKDAGGTKLANSLVTRFNIGINYEIPLAPEFCFQPGLQFITKGTKGPVMYTDNSGTHSITREIKLNYIEMPLNLVFKPILGNGYMILGFGPYVGYSIGGKAKFTGSPAPSDADIQFVKTAPDNDANNLIYFKKLDVGANFFVGYELGSGLNLVLNSQLGLININSATTSKMANKNTGFGLALGYRF